MMEWKKNLPTKAGVYWIFHLGDVRIITVFESLGKLYTPWDGGAPITDEMFKGVQWAGPINPPPPPK